MRYFRRYIIAICSGFCFALAAPQALAGDKLEDAVRAGVQYLANNQDKDGGWPGPKTQKDPAVTALCVMAFLSAGHVPGEGKYAENISRGIRYVMACQTTSGLFEPKGFKNAQEMYTHGICTLMMAEVVGLMPSEKEARQVREQLEKAVRIILKAQRGSGESRGGWRYTVAGVDADLSVTGWQIMALRAAKNSGCDVPGEAIEAAMLYVERCWDPRFRGYAYQPNSYVTLACTGTAIVAFELSGRERHRLANSLEAASTTIGNGDKLASSNSYFAIAVYYSTQAMFQLGDQFWLPFRQRLHGLILSQGWQMREGGWVGRSRDDILYGNNYFTAVMILSLTVEFRFLPIYQRNETASP